MAHANVQRPCMCPWRQSAQRLSRRLFCCSCLCCEEKDPLQGKGEGINRGPQPLHVDKWGSGEKEAVQITVEDLGIVNSSFILSEEDPLTHRNSTAHSASSGSAFHRAQKKKQMKPLVSLPLQLQAEPDTASTSGEVGDEEESGTHCRAASGSLLTPPVINLIPPTPSDVDDDQFFDNNSEESVAHRSDRDGSFASTDQGSYEEKMESVEAEDSKQGCRVAENGDGADSGAEAERGPGDQCEEDMEAAPTKGGDRGKSKPGLLRGVYEVAPLPEYPLQSEPNNDLSNSDLRCANMAATDVCTSMQDFAHQRRPITRSSRFGETLTRSATFHALTQTTAQRQEEGSPRQRRITVASYTPQPTDQNGNFPEKDTAKQATKSLGELNTGEICRWFTSIGLEKCLPFIREAKLCGTEIASINVNTLDILHITTLEDRELLLSAIYDELHPPSAVTQRLDSLLETLGPNHVETFTATLVSMSKSKSSPHVSCLSLNRRSLKLRNNSQNRTANSNTQLIEITVTASERIVHLRTPRETTVGKIMDSCIKMLGVTEDKRLFMLKEKQGSLDELLPDQQIGSLLPSTSETRQLELHLCKAENPAIPASPEVNSANESGEKNLQPAKEERIRELKQQVDSLQNAILQVQELHHSLVAFCAELKSMDADVCVDGLGSAELKQRLELVERRVHDKKQSLRTLRDNISKSAAHKTKQLEVHLLEKMKLNCQVFKEEISMVHLNRQVAQLRDALQESIVKEKAQQRSLASCSLGQLVSPQCPAMLLVVQEIRLPDGHYGFTCRYREGSGLVVAEVDDSHLRVDDRLLEVNGVLVVSCTQEELTQLLLQGPSAQIVVLRQPPPTVSSQQHPLLPQHMVDPGPMKIVCQEKDVVTMETPPQRKLMAI